MEEDILQNVFFNLVIFLNMKLGSTTNLLSNIASPVVMLPSVTLKDYLLSLYIII